MVLFLEAKVKDVAIDKWQVVMDHLLYIDVDQIGTSEIAIAAVSSIYLSQGTIVYVWTSVHQCVTVKILIYFWIFSGSVLVVLSGIKLKVALTLYWKCEIHTDI